MDLCDADRLNDHGDMYCVAPAIRYEQAADEWAKYINEVQADAEKEAELNEGDNIQKNKYYVLIVYGDVEPALRGPFPGPGHRDDMAKLYKRHYGDEHGIYRLDQEGETLKVDSYSHGVFLERCTRCGEEKTDVEERYSYGVYAGRLCLECCFTYTDHCGIDQLQGSPRELEEMGETYWEEE